MHDTKSQGEINILQYRDAGSQNITDLSGVSSNLRKPLHTPLSSIFLFLTRIARHRGEDQGMFGSAGGRVSATVKNSPIKKISFLRGNEGWRAINVRRENDLWAGGGGRGCAARGRRGRAYHKLMNYQGAREWEGEKKRGREREKESRAMRQCGI